jgi:ABC-type antimicrobial peptide transport system permease subunit
LLLGEVEMLALPGSVLGAAVSFGLAQRARLLMPALPVSTQPLYGRLGVNSGAFIGLVADEPPARRASRLDPVDSLRAGYGMQSIIGSLERERIAGLRHRVPDRTRRSAAQ